MTSDNFIQKIEVIENKIKSFSFIIAAAICVLFCGYFVVSNLLESEQLYEIRLDEKINPNDASAASLVRLPGIGIGRAHAPVTYLENSPKKGGNGLTFQNDNDLRKVKGIGPKVLQNMNEWLEFE